MSSSDLNAINAIDIIEMVAAKLGFGYYKSEEDEISVLLSRGNSEYILLVELRQESYEALYFSCDLGIDLPKGSYESNAVAVVKANEHSWLGHFDLVSCSDNRGKNNERIVYSLTMPFASSFNFDEINVEAIFKIIVDECDRFHQYFAITLEANKKGNKISNLSLNTFFFEAAGEA